MKRTLTILAIIMMIAAFAAVALAATTTGHKAHANAAGKGACPMMGAKMPSMDKTGGKCPFMGQAAKQSNDSCCATGKMASGKCPMGGMTKASGKQMSCPMMGRKSVKGHVAGRVSAGNHKQTPATKPHSK